MNINKIKDVDIIGKSDREVLILFYKKINELIDQLKETDLRSCRNIN